MFRKSICQTFDGLPTLALGKSKPFLLPLGEVTLIHVEITSRKNCVTAFCFDFVVLLLA